MRYSMPSHNFYIRPLCRHIAGYVRSKAKWRWGASRISDNKTSRSVALRLGAGQIHILSGRGEQKPLENQEKLVYGRYGLLWVWAAYAP